MVIMGGSYPYELADGQPWEYMESVTRNSFPENIYSPTAPIHSINGMRITRCRSWKMTQALQMTMRSLDNTSTEHEWTRNPIATNGYAQGDKLTRIGL